ncbi:NLR family member X1 isoform X2 [Periophthalmus magnuspinnatus]|uniref:NLR family member X1 isoform X2 n=1 Tax=Periophthalmus magnuspinnatus TaxID=409849 RepID=UPI0024374468|nr:NLR family member X1 isoform X2 [Periophthalmus magnuspinnatus]
MGPMQRGLSQLLGRCRRKPWAELCFCATSGERFRTYCSSTSPHPADLDPLEVHKQRLQMWFSHLPQEEKQFGGYFSPETMHVDPLILERKPEERARLLSSAFSPHSQHLSKTVEELFEPSPSWDSSRGLNVLLYGAVGTGKSTVVRKLVLDWCRGRTLGQFKLLIPFSCEDLSQLSKVSSLRDLVSRKYLQLRKHPLLSGEGDQARDILFLFNGLEKMKLDFRIGSTELCSDPNEALPPAVVVVNLLRKYLLPQASILVTTRLSAVDRVPPKYISRHAQICGFIDPDRQRAYFAKRLLQQTDDAAPKEEAQALIELLYLNLQRESQLATACFLPSYCWLTCATLHFLHFTNANAPIRTLTGIYTSFLRLNFGGEVLGMGTGAGTPIQDHHNSLMLYVVQTVGKLAFDGVTNKRMSFSEKELEQWIGGKTKTDEELRQLAMFRTDVLDFFLAPSVDSNKPSSAKLSEHEELRYVFAAPAMQEYLAALYVVLGENKSALEILSKQVSKAIGQASEDVNALLAIISKFIPLRIFTIFNLLKLVPKLFEKFTVRNQGRIGRTLATEMFRTEDSYNEDVLDQVEQNLLGVHGPHQPQKSEEHPFELYPIFMGGLLNYGNRVLLQQLGCTIQNDTVAQITKALRKYLVRELSKPQPPEELMDLLFLLYEFQNPRLTAEVLSYIRSVRLRNIRMTSLKCYVLSSVLSCTPPSYHLEVLDLSSCLLTCDMIRILLPAFRHTHHLKLCDNPILNAGAASLLEALPENQSLRHLSLMHTGLADGGAVELAQALHKHSSLEELNVAYNNIGDNAALSLVDACREHPTIHTLHLYLNPLSDVGKRSLYVRGDPSKSGRKVRVLASVTEGSDLSEDWHPILSVIIENAKSWDRERVKQQLRVFLRDLEWGRQQQPSFWKRLHFWRVERGIRETLKMLEKDQVAHVCDVCDKTPAK